MARDGCWPPRHVGRWRGYFIGTPLYETPDGASAEFPIGDLVLNLDEDGAGTLTFGVPPEGVAASDRPLVPCAPGDVAPECPVWASVLANFAYQLDQLALFDPEQAKVPTRFNGEPLPQRAEHMDFVVHAGEPWDTWCTQEPEIEDRCTGGDCGSGDGLPPSAAAFEHPLEQGVAPSGCRCDAAECRADGPLLSISLQMAGIEERPVLRGTYTATDPRIGSATLEFAKDRYP
ncbi:MAG TPA: hypothetical protein VMG12_05440 [Polyangiaceae bacterium]|nr:hypothetical protein [Polyangiaceae bacterium]